MSVTSVSSPPIVYGPSVAPPVKQGVTDVSSALEAGDIASAQSAFKNLAQTATPNPNSPLAPGIKQLTDALKAGDLSGAQDALASLQQQVLAYQANPIMQPYNSGGSSTATTDPSALLNITA